MGEPDISSIQRRMRHSIHRLHGHLAWKSLKESESSPGDPPVLLMDQNLAAEIRNEQCQFLRAEGELRDALNTTIWISGRDRQEYRRELRRLNEEFRRLDLPKGI